MKEIKYCPSTLEEGYATYSPKALKSLFDGKKASHMLDFNMEKSQFHTVVSEDIAKMSVSGVQEKFPAVLEDGKIRIALVKDRSTYILKPAPLDNVLQWRKQIPANEHLTMQIASQAYGIRTAPNGLCFTSDNQAVYITRRFDIMADGTKIPMEDFASLIGKNEKKRGLHYKYDGCYEDIANAIKQHVQAWMVDIERFFELVLFNYIYANGDDHFKNFSLIKRGEDYRLAPAYDLINTSLHIKGDDFGLDGGLSPNIEQSDVMSRTGHPCRLDFERFGNRIGIVGIRLSMILDKYMRIPDQARRLIANSFLTEKMKRSYLRIIMERTRRYVRNSE